ncbi:MAG TPA: alkaline phosphatase family protein, partial [Rhodopila sp.]
MSGILTALIVGGSAVFPAPAGQAAEPAPAGAPRLAVAISIDQFRFDYLTRFRPFFGPGGFEKLLSGGADYEECHHRHAVTKTGPGHAAMLSGVFANTSGIVGNDWLDRATWQTMNAVEDPDSPIVGADSAAPHSPGGLLERKSGRSPRNFLATTVGDQLKLRYGAGSRVIAISNKDRAAILMGGKLADTAYWLEKDRFVTSRYYAAELPAWAE